MGLDEHFDRRDEVKEEGQTSQVDAHLTPPLQAIEHGRKDGDTRRRVKNRRNSEPEQMHLEFHLKALLISIL